MKICNVLSQYIFRVGSIAASFLLSPKEKSSPEKKLLMISFYILALIKSKSGRLNIKALLSFYFTLKFCDLIFFLLIHNAIILFLFNQWKSIFIKHAIVGIASKWIRRNHIGVWCNFSLEKDSILVIYHCPKKKREIQTRFKIDFGLCFTN